MNTEIMGEKEKLETASQILTIVLCGCGELGEALRRFAEGYSMIRTKCEVGTGNVLEAVRHCCAVMGDIRRLVATSEDEIYVYTKEIRAPLELVV